MRGPILTYTVYDSHQGRPALYTATYVHCLSILRDMVREYKFMSQGRVNGSPSTSSPGSYRADTLSKALGASTLTECRDVKSLTNPLDIAEKLSCQLQAMTKLQ